MLQWLGCGWGAQTIAKFKTTTKKNVTWEKVLQRGKKWGRRADEQRKMKGGVYWEFCAFRVSQKIAFQRSLFHLLSIYFETFKQNTPNMEFLSESVSRVQFFGIPWAIQSMEFSRPEYWSGQPFPSPGDLPNPGIQPRFPALQADSLPAEPPVKPKNTGVGSLSLLQGIFLTQEWNQGLLHCWRILYQLSYQGSQWSFQACNKYFLQMVRKEKICQALKNPLLPFTF